MARTKTIRMHYSQVLYYPLTIAFVLSLIAFSLLFFNLVGLLQLETRLEALRETERSTLQWKGSLSERLNNTEKGLEEGKILGFEFSNEMEVVYPTVSAFLGQ